MRRPLTELCVTSTNVWPHTRSTSSTKTIQMPSCTSAAKKCLSRSTYGDVRVSLKCERQLARGRTTAVRKNAATSSSEVITARREMASTLSGMVSVAATVTPASTTTGTGHSAAINRRSSLPACSP